MLLGNSLKKPTGRSGNSPRNDRMGRGQLWWPVGEGVTKGEPILPLASTGIIPWPGWGAAWAQPTCWLASGAPKLQWLFLWQQHCVGLERRRPLWGSVPGALQSFQQWDTGADQLHTSFAIRQPSAEDQIPSTWETTFLFLLLGLSSMIAKVTAWRVSQVLRAAAWPRAAPPT